MKTLKLHFIKSIKKQSVIDDYKFGIFFIFFVSEILFMSEYTDILILENKEQNVDDINCCFDLIHFT
jgi:hypothetical protein